MGFFSSFAVPDSLGITLGGGSDQSVDGIVSGNQGISNTDSVAPSPSPPTFIQQQTSKAKDVLSDYFLVKDAEGNLMPVQTGLGLVGKATGPMGMLGTGVT